VSEFQLNHPTEDVQAAFDWLLSQGFLPTSSRGAPLDGNQLFELSDGFTRVWMTRDKGQWMLDIEPAGWDERCQFHELLSAMRLEHLSTGVHHGPMPGQLPPGESWVGRLPEVLDWVLGSPHRAVYVEAEGQHYGTRNFGGRGGSASLEQIERWIGRLASAIDAPPRHLPTYGFSEDFARPHIEAFGMNLAFVVIERGEELERHEFTETVDLLGRVFRGVTFNMAVDWEVRHRSEAEDFRRRLWAQQLVLLNRLHPLWAKQLAISHAAEFREVGLAPADAAEIVARAGLSSGKGGV